METERPVKLPFEVTEMDGSTKARVLLVALVVPPDAVMAADVPVAAPGWYNKATLAENTAAQDPLVTRTL